MGSLNWLHLFIWSLILGCLIAVNGQIVFTDTDLTISSGDYDIEYSESVILTVPELRNSDTGYGVFAFWFCPTDGQIYGAAYTLSSEGKLSEKVATTQISYEESCNRAQLDADYYWDSSTSTLQIGVVWSCRIDTVYQLFYSVTLQFSTRYFLFRSC